MVQILGRNATMTKYRFFEIVKFVMIKKIFIALSLFIPLFCWASEQKDISLNLKGIVKIALPDNIENITTFSDMTVVKVKGDKGFAYGIIDISKDYPKEKNYSFFYKCRI